MKTKCLLKILDTDEKWYGVTYKEDKKDLVNAINKMIEEENILKSMELVKSSSFFPLFSLIKNIYIRYNNNVIRITLRSIKMSF